LKVALHGIGLRLPGFEEGVPLKPQIAAANNTDIPEWKKNYKKRNNKSVILQSDIENDRHLSFPWNYNIP